MKPPENGTAVDKLLASIEAGEPPPADIFAPAVILDATVPNWRFSRRGAEAVRAELSRWYRDPGTFEEVKRHLLPRGELVEFTLTWEENAIPHACHQVHVLMFEDGRVAQHTVFCGGRWPASLLAEMADAERVATG
jgi:hypothetical protein